MARKQSEKSDDKLEKKKICRICLCEDEGEKENPLVSPCNCDGTMKYIHIDCLKGWVNSKWAQKETQIVKTYLWKILTCELCKQRFPDFVKYEGKSYDLIQYEVPE